MAGRPPISLKRYGRPRGFGGWSALGPRISAAAFSGFASALRADANRRMAGGLRPPHPRSRRERGCAERGCAGYKSDGTRTHTHLILNPGCLPFHHTLSHIDISNPRSRIPVGRHRPRFLDPRRPLGRWKRPPPPYRRRLRRLPNPHPPGGGRVIGGLPHPHTPYPPRPSADGGFRQLPHPPGGGTAEGGKGVCGEGKPLKAAA